jgi:hypothetical protein
MIHKMSSAGRSPASPGDRVARVATFVLPTASVLVAALVFLGPGALRPALGSRVRGLPAEGTHALALRIEVVKALYDVVDGAGEHELLVEASAPGQTLRGWHGTTGADGVVEARVEGNAPIRGPVALAVTALSPRKKLLAAGEVSLDRPLVVPAQVGRIPGTTRGDLDIRVDATRGFLAAPFTEEVRVAVSSGGSAGAPAARAEIELSGVGIDVAPPQATADERGRAAFNVKPLAHQVELAVVAHAGSATARWEGTLPVVPGAMWLAPGSGRKTRALLSPVPRERAYVSFWSEDGRVAGAVVPLARDAQGFHAGELSIPEAHGHILFASLAGDPLEQGAGTVAWPIEPPEGAMVAPPLALLLDGLPAAQDRERQRAWASRRVGLILIGAAAIAEVLLLLVQSRAAQRRLEEHLAEASGTLPEADRARLMDSAREHPLLRALLAVALVGLAFALVAALSTFR